METNWKTEIEDNVRGWLSDIDNYEFENDSESQDGPDLYSFYQELCALGMEVRKSARRSHDTFSRFGETLSSFEEMIVSLTDQLSGQKDNNRDADIMMQKKLYLPIVELFERFKRMKERLSESPGSAFFPGNRKWKNAWTSLREGFEILHAHIEALIKTQGINILNTKNTSFDPSYMIALDVRESQSNEPGTVLEEISGCYMLEDFVLKLAEVIICKNKEL